MTRQEELQKEYQTNQNTLQSLLSRQQQIIGALTELDRIDKEAETTSDKESDKEEVKPDNN